MMPKWQDKMDSIAKVPRGKTDMERSQALRRSQTMEGPGFSFGWMYRWVMVMQALIAALLEGSNEGLKDALTCFPPTSR